MVEGPTANVEMVDGACVGQRPLHVGLWSSFPIEEVTNWLVCRQEKICNGIGKGGNAQVQVQQQRVVYLLRRQS